MVATRRTPKRKLQPELKYRGEAFLNAAGASPSLKETVSTETRQSSKRRKISTPTTPSSRKAVELAGVDESGKKPSLPSPKTLKARSTNSKDESPKREPTEKRLRLMRKQAPKSYLEKLQRAQTQRMIVVDRIRKDTESCPIEEISIVGTTGNIYKASTLSMHAYPFDIVLPALIPTQALHTVLKAPTHLQYQLALLTSELREIFAQAPPIPTQAPSSDDTSGNRKPIEGECPICYMDFDPENNELVWCKAACGNNMHKDCFDKWRKSSGGGVRCVYCRAPWQSDASEVHSVTGSQGVNAEGYVNVAAEFGLSGERDYSSYHQPWVRRTLGGAGSSWNPRARFDDYSDGESEFEE